MRSLDILMNSECNIKGVDVNFIGTYNYPYFLYYYKGYSLKVVDSITKKECKQSDIISNAGYLPIYIVDCDGSLYKIKSLDKEKTILGFNSITLEIENIDIKSESFNGVILFNIRNANDGEDLVVCCDSFIKNGNRLIIKGLGNDLNSCIKSSLIFYNRRKLSNGRLR